MIYNINKDDDPNRQQGASSGTKTTDMTGGLNQSATKTMNAQTGADAAGGSSADGLDGIIVPGDASGGTYTPPAAVKTGNGTQGGGAAQGKTTTTPQPASTSAGKSYASYADMFNAMYPQETPEQERKRRRNERATLVASAIGDGLRALSDIYFASRGAKIQHDPKNDLTARAQARLDALRAEREKNRDAWVTGVMKARQQDESNALEREKLDAERQRKKREEDRQNALDDEKKRATQKKEEQEDQRLRNDADRIAAMNKRNDETARHNRAVESGKGKTGKGSSSGGGKSGGKGKTQKRDWGGEYIKLMNNPKFKDIDAKYERMQRRGQISQSQRQRKVVEELSK